MAFVIWLSADPRTPFPVNFSIFGLRGPQGRRGVARNAKKGRGQLPEVGDGIIRPNIEFLKLK
jgi:hypothetical protein